MKRYRVKKRADKHYVVQEYCGFFLWWDMWFCETKEDAENFIRYITQ